MKRAGSMLCPVILGRDHLLELMDHLIAEARQGHGRTLFLSGSGRPRQDAADPGDHPQGGGRPGSASTAAPSRRRTARSRSRRSARWLPGCAATPDWGTLSEDLLAIAGRHDGDALGARRVIVRAAADRILEAIDRPTLLIFDDLHWADEMSLEVIGELARHGSELPALPARRLPRRRVSRPTRSIANGDRGC